MGGAGTGSGTRRRLPEEQGTGWGFGTGSGTGTGGGFGGGKRAGRGEGAGHGTGIPDDEEMLQDPASADDVWKTGTGENPAGAAAEFQTQVAQLPANAQDTLRQALAGIAEQGRGKKLDKAVLVQLAEHLAIRFAHGALLSAGK